MIGVGLSATLSGGRKARVNLDPMPALDLNFAANRSLPADYGPTPSFSRASTGTLFNSSGVLTSAAVNVPRFDHVYIGGSWVSRGLLVEEQRTNLCIYSEDFSNAEWFKTASSISSNVINAPDGQQTADKIVENTANDTHYINFTVGKMNSSGTYTNSFFAKAGERTWCRVYIYDGSTSASAWFNLSSGTVGTVNSGITAAIQNVGNGWYRCSATRTITGSNQANGGIILATGDNVSSYTGDGSSGIYIWGAQLESAAFNTSYIPSLSNSSTTRSADVCQITGTSFSSFWNAGEGSIAAEYDILHPSGVDKILFNASNAGASASIYYTDAATAYYVVYNGGVQAQLTPGSEPAANTVTRVALCYKANDFAVTRNGASVLTDTSGNIPTVDRFNIGDQTGSGKINGHISRLRYYPTRLTNATLQSLCT